MRLLDGEIEVAYRTIQREGWGQANHDQPRYRAIHRSR